MRRLVDYRAGWIPATPMMAAPFLAASVSAVVLLAGGREWTNRQMLPLVPALGGVFYGLVIGIYHFGAGTACAALPGWVAPLLFAGYLCQQSEHRVEIRRSFERAFVQGGLAISLYGLYQYFLLPPWDRFWMEHVAADIPSIGQPVPLQVRLFSTINAPQSLGTALLVSILFTVTIRSRWRLPVVALATCCLAFTLSRSAWLGVTAGLLCLFLHHYLRRRLYPLLLLPAAILALHMLLPNALDNQTVSGRMQSFTDLHGDESYLDRWQGYREAFASIMNEPFAQGLGSAEEIHKAKADEPIGAHDSTILECLFSLGWVGTLLYVSGAAMLARRVCMIGGQNTLFSSSAKAVLVALVVQVLLNSITVGFPGFVLWSAAVLCLPVEEFHRSLAARMRAPLAMAGIPKRFTDNESPS
jgi:hypothetical protein